jgi:hypothetical protein
VLAVSGKEKAKKGDHLRSHEIEEWSSLIIIHIPSFLTGCLAKGLDPELEEL